MDIDPAIQLNGPATEIDKTVVVLGMPRGGTSMVACALHHLNVPLNHDAVETDDYQPYEDERITRAVSGPELDERALGEIIDENNAAHPLWGLKAPLGFRHLARIEPMLRAPCYVVLFRDPLAVHQRWVAHGHDATLSERPRDLTALAKFCETTRRPLLMVGYERARNAPGRFVQQLAKFLRIRPNPGTVRACERDPRYRRGLRIGVDLDRTVYGFPDFFGASIPAWVSAGHRVVCSSGHCREHWPADEPRLRGLGIDPELIDASLLRSEQEPDMPREKARIIDSCDVAFDDDADNLQTLTHTPILRMPGWLGADAKGK